MPAWLPIVVTVGTFLLSILTGIIGYFLNKHMGRVDLLEQLVGELRKENDSKAQQLRKEFEDLKAQLPFLYVLREDWIRYQTAIERKLDQIISTVTELKIQAAQTQTKGGGDGRGD